MNAAEQTLAPIRLSVTVPLSQAHVASRTPRASNSSFILHLASCVVAGHAVQVPAETSKKSPSFRGAVSLPAPPALNVEIVHDPDIRS